ncbi:MAG TPA: hypothetical protein EYG97_00920 [Arcobacter sp.]|nr:hypothetical protein [Arcobacter sp.]HIP55565.1 hypothetical protein [Arcobacter sp.]
MTLTEAVTQDIKILGFELKEEDELKSILKRRLTKKEFKYYKMRNEEASNEEIISSLVLDEKRYDAMVIAVYKKINSEKIKNELIIKD